MELRVEGVLGAGRLSLDARDHLALRSQGLGEASCAAEGFREIHDFPGKKISLFSDDIELFLWDVFLVQSYKEL